MLSAKDLGGLMAMMPAFATDNAADIRATSTVDMAKLHKGVDRMIRDGANVMAAAGSFGEFHTLLPDEFEVLANETVAAAKKRVPVFIGTTSLNSREVVQKMKIVEKSGADGVLLGVPFYFPSTVDNAVRFYREIGEMFPKLNIMIYHNPTLHNIKIPVEAFVEITKNPAVIGMKDSHRDMPEFLKLHAHRARQDEHLRDADAVFQSGRPGAAGFWSIDAWMGPWPQLALRDAVARGDREAGGRHHARSAAAARRAR